MTIDWNKPLRTKGNQFKARLVDLPNRSNVTNFGNRIVEFHNGYGWYITVVDGNGRCIDENGWNVSHYDLENVPEEPKDTLYLIRRHGSNKWKIDNEGNPMSRSQAEELKKHYSSSFDVKMVTIDV